jgi:tRNA pseudouridine38-40 synthase
MNIALTIAYEGTSYLGWQKTNTGPSIEEALQKILEKILQHDVRLQAASRTDRGVHAKGQVVNFFTSKFNLESFDIEVLDKTLKHLKNSLNDLLPKDIVILDIEKKDNAFHPTIDCKKKEYHYHICNTPYQLPWFRLYSWHCYKPLNLELMSDAISLFSGNKDFQAFCNVKKNETYDSTIRLISHLSIEEACDNRFIIKIIGNNFLYKMVRNIAGTLVYLGSKKLDKSQLIDALEKNDRKLIGMTAPAHGLFLHKVYYE